MSPQKTNESILDRPLRLWPGIAIVVIQWITRFVVSAVFPEATIIGVLVGLACGLLIILWWLFLSRAAWTDRAGGAALLILAVIGSYPLLDVSIATGGMGMLFLIYVIPVLSLAFVLWAAFSRNLSINHRRLSMAATVLLVCGVFTLFRTDGMSGEGSSDFQWRWSKTKEERLLDQASEKLSATGEALLADDSKAEWPGFRGPDRKGIVEGTRIQTDWSTSPPVEMWRRPVGPGWSSFAVRGDLFYTQEQRGEEEVVGCYRVSTGEPVWKHKNATRFWESNAGAGPRATPTLKGDRVYTFGATGILNALDARDGSVIWSRNAAAETETKTPDWGFSSSPLVFEDMVVVALIGTPAAYDLDTGEPRWIGKKGGGSYSSPHLLEIEGEAQILQMMGAGARSVSPIDGSLLWEHNWPGVSIVQPSLIAEDELLISTGDRSGVRRIKITTESKGWKTEELWTSNKLKPYFNDLVIHKDHAYGFDSGILACIDLADGKRKWKGGRYGRGQLVLLADQELLIVLSEKGEVALVSATSDQLVEYAKIPAIEGKTWNHPVVVDDVLLVRNDHEMAAFRLEQEQS